MPPRRSDLRGLRRFALAAVLACAALARASTGEGEAASSADPATITATRRIDIPVHEASGADVAMVTQVFLPAGAGRFPVVVFSHGRPPGAAGRATLKQGASRAQLRYWLAHGVAVVAPIRPGYGPTGGRDAEQSGVRYDAYGQCVNTPDYRKTAEAGARTVVATLDWLRAQPWADAGHVLLVGQSVGGLTTVSAGAQPLPGVVGYINFAGGTGGNPELSPGRSCDPAQLTALYEGFGKTTTVPNLWVYAANDQYWGPDEPRAWHAAFARGGSSTTFVQAPAVADGDGHGLSRHAERLWAAYVDAFLAKTGFGVGAGSASR